jgi:methylmalonyl-CoA mutase N-terminal domain/subunit
VVCGGASLYAPQPHNNIVRVAYEAMAAVLGGVQSMFTAAWDEPFALPTEESTTLALRTQQLLAHETGVTRVTDPLGGSYYVEALTDAMEERIAEIMADLESYGGMVKAIEEGYVQRLISEEAYRSQRRLESGESVVVGVNRFQTDEPAPEVHGYEMGEADKARQLGRLAEVRRERDAGQVADCLRTLGSAAAGDANLMPHLVEAVKAYCTLGEISDVLRDAWGEFQQPVVF